MKKKRLALLFAHTGPELGDNLRRGLACSVGTGHVK
jgi:hypothetical protein